jgi:hypothetical protein
MQKVIDQQAKLGQSIKNSGKESKESTSSSLEGIAKMGAAYLSVSSAIGVVKASLQDQLDLQKESLAIAQQIAKSQSSASKNLTGLSTEEKRKVLEEARSLQQEIGFSDQKFIVDAIGAGYSAAGDLGLAKSATKAAAELSRNAPEELSGIATGAVDLSRGSGVKDAKSNLGFALQVGAISRVEDPAAVVRWLAPAISSAVNTVPKQDKQEASKEVGSVWSELNKFANDVQGMSTKTATIDLMARMEEFFRTIPEERAKIDAKVQELERKKEVTPVERARLDRSEFDVDQKERKLSKYSTAYDETVKRVGEVRDDDDSPSAKARRQKLADVKAKFDDAVIDLAEAKANRDQLLVDVVLSPTEEIDLAKLKKQQGAMKDVQDPGTIFGRIEKFQADPALRDTFLDNPFGEAAFKGGYRELLTKDSPLAKATVADKATLSFDSREFNRNVAEQETLSPELRVSKIKSAEEGRKQAAATSGDKPFQGVIQDIVTQTLRENRRFALGGVIDYGFESIGNLAGGTSTDAKTSAILGMQALEMRKTQIKKDQMFGEFPGDSKKIENLEKASMQIAKIFAEVEAPLTTESVLIDREVGEGKKPVVKQAPAPAGGNEAAPIIDQDSRDLLREFIKKADALIATQQAAAPDVQAQQLDVLKKIEEKSGPRPDANANAIRAQVAGAQ